MMRAWGARDSRAETYESQDHGGLSDRGLTCKSTGLSEKTLHGEGRVRPVISWRAGGDVRAGWARTEEDEFDLDRLVSGGA